MTKIEELRKALAGHLNPPLMAIGDSIFNGTRSLTNRADMAAWSAPAQVARALGVSDFAVPEYPRPVLWELEEAIDRLDILDGIDWLNDVFAGARKNAALWRNDGWWSTVRTHDNLAFAGATIQDLTEANYADFDEPPGAVNMNSIAGLLRQYDSAATIAEKALTLASLFFAINTSYVLNPRRSPDFADCTAMDLVEARAPKNLIVMIGSNNGLFRSALGGSFTKKVADQIAEIPSLWAPLLDRLTGLDKKVERIVVPDMLRPSALAQLSPQGDFDYSKRPGCGDYFAQGYTQQIGAVTYSAKEMQNIDAAIAAVNAGIAKAVAKVKDPRITLLKMSTFADPLDGKHGCAPGGIEVMTATGLWTLDNKPLRKKFGVLGQGGLFSLDNMHPTLVGYSALADAYLGALSAKKRTSAQAAYDADTLLRNLPSSLTGKQLALKIAFTVLAPFFDRD